MPGNSGSRTPAAPPPDPAESTIGPTATLSGAQPQTSDNTPVGMAARAGSPGPTLRWCRRHAVFLVVLLLGVGWRVLAELAFRPALVTGESRSHLYFLTSSSPDPAQWSGYAILELRPLSWFTDSLAAVAAVQHLMGVVTGIGIYAVLRRWGVWRWLAAAAATPVLWDAYQLASEHLVLPDTLFVCLLVLAVVALCWRARPTAAVALVAGLLLGLASTVRPGGGLLVLGAVAYLLITGGTHRNRVAGALALVLGCAVPVLPYLAWYHHATGEYVPQRDHAVADSGLGALDGVTGYADWSRTGPTTEPGIATWRFDNYLRTDGSPPGDRRQTRPGAETLVAYQDHGYLPGPLLLGGLAVGFLAAVGVGRARSTPLRAPCALTAAVPVGLMIAAAWSGDLSWRDQFPALALLPVTGALGVTALLRGRRGPAAARRQVDEVDTAALDGFRDAYGDPEMAPVVVVIAAYNEAVGLPRVLSSMPSTVCELRTDVVVVDDGSTDDTPQAALSQTGVYVVRCPVNRGQGAAMRLGYRVAREHGARFIITTDADAQYDTADFPVVLTPILEGSADFVTGSRRLGHQHTIDRFRRAGVYVFAWIISALTGRWLTDTSFGLRAMRAEVTEAVTLNQPQYQSAELLIGAHSHGFRVVEVPGTMHLRAAGSTKKGGNLVYGMRYARVVLGTWWREGCPAPPDDHAPALLGTVAGESVSRTTSR